MGGDPKNPSPQCVKAFIQEHGWVSHADLLMCGWILKRSLFRACAIHLLIMHDCINNALSQSKQKVVVLVCVCGRLQQHKFHQQPHLNIGLCLSHTFGLSFFCV